MDKRKCERVLDALGMELARDAGRQGNTFFATIDAKGRNGFDGDCRGVAVFANVMGQKGEASRFWDEVAQEGRDHAAHITPCPWPEGECDFHDEEDEE